MSSFDRDFDATRRNAILTRRTALVSGTATQSQKDQLLIDVLELLTDDPQMSADQREYNRALNVDGYPNNPEFRHEFLMGMDENYRAAWAYDHTQGLTNDFSIEADEDPNKMAAVLRGRTNHPYREDDPDIVWRSLYRNGYRELEEGETPPPDPAGRYAPDVIAILPSIPRAEIVPALGS